jgi:CBS domain-containing protein
MRVYDAMCEDIEVVTPDITLQEAAEIMRDCECGYLPIGENDRLVGAVTDRDIVVRGLAKGLDPEDTTVEEIMTERIVYCYEDDNLRDAAEQMKREQVRRLVVLDGNKRMVGVLSVGDIARACGDRHLTGDIETGVAQVA